MTSPKTLIFVDDLIGWPDETTGQAARIFGRGKESCHLMAAGDLSELHAFAARIGMRGTWYQNVSWPHYDLTKGRRASAVKAGAIEVDGRILAAARVAVKRRIRQETGDFRFLQAQHERATLLLREYFDDNGTPKMTAAEMLKSCGYI